MFNLFTNNKAHFSGLLNHSIVCTLLKRREKMSDIPSLYLMACPHDDPPATPDMSRSSLPSQVPGGVSAGLLRAAVRPQMRLPERRQVLPRQRRLPMRRGLQGPQLRGPLLSPGPLRPDLRQVLPLLRAQHRQVRSEICTISTSTTSTNTTSTSTTTSSSSSLLVVVWRKSRDSVFPGGGRLTRHC